MDCPWTCQAEDPTQSPSLIIGFTEKILYTTRIHFWDIGIRSEREHYGHATTEPHLRQQKRP